MAKAQGKEECKCKYEADGTIHVRYDSCGNIKSVTFIPFQYVEQSGSKFVVFTPQCPSSGASYGLVAKASEPKGAPKGVKLCVGGTPCKASLLVEAAVKGTKVTVLVSKCKGKLKLKEVVVPAIPAKPAT